MSSATSPKWGLLPGSSIRIQGEGLHLMPESHVFPERSSVSECYAVRPKCDNHQRVHQSEPLDRDAEQVGGSTRAARDLQMGQNLCSERRIHDDVAGDSPVLTAEVAGMFRERNLASNMALLRTAIHSDVAWDHGWAVQVRYAAHLLVQSFKERELLQVA